jgi:transposase-like protein
LALFIDGVHLAEQAVIVAMAVTREGKKEPLELCAGSTENSTVCKQLLQELRERGLEVDGPMLCVIDGGKWICKALADVLGHSAVTQRCQIHKLRNLEGLVPKARQVYVRSLMRKAYGAKSAVAARQELRNVAGWLEANGYVDAAGSVREGREERSRS